MSFDEYNNITKLQNTCSLFHDPSIHIELLKRTGTFENKLNKTNYNIKNKKHTIIRGSELDLSFIPNDETGIKKYIDATKRASNGAHLGTCKVYFWNDDIFTEYSNNNFEKLKFLPGFNNTIHLDFNNGQIDHGNLREMHKDDILVCN